MARNAGAGGDRGCGPGASRRSGARRAASRSCPSPAACAAAMTVIGKADWAHCTGYGGAEEGDPARWAPAGSGRGRVGVWGGVTGVRAGRRNSSESKAELEREREAETEAGRMRRPLTKGADGAESAVSSSAGNVHAHASASVTKHGNMGTCGCGCLEWQYPPH